jgi:hypothetical protein
VFDDERRWRLDFAWPSLKVGVELSGIGFGHQSIKGIKRDAEKLRRATVLGWRVFTYTSACLGSRAKVQEAVEEVWSFLCGVKEHGQEELSGHQSCDCGPSDDGREAAGTGLGII